MDTRVLIQSARNLMQPFPYSMMLHIKFDQVWPTGLGDIIRSKVWTTTDGGPLLYYKLTLWAFGSGELKCGSFFRISSMSFFDNQGQITPK